MVSAWFQFFPWVLFAAADRGHCHLPLLYDPAGSSQSLMHACNLRNVNSPPSLVLKAVGAPGTLCSRGTPPDVAWAPLGVAWTPPAVALAPITEAWPPPGDDPWPHPPREEPQHPPPRVEPWPPPPGAPPPRAASEPWPNPPGAKFRDPRPTPATPHGHLFLLLLVKIEHEEAQIHLNRPHFPELYFLFEP
ncbi:hypothetical protein SELMODRAFT_415423 [Selaginella moellendorffii]|uniref:Uncharacterized protein n=1 Tax=Selaginella moellendorffii TaxID=88036 RepID=D8RW31_SELML|nr:hypothetical protein SELMODRAFT_415423 [Selaginella moellendorffii]